MIFQKLSQGFPKRNQKIIILNPKLDYLDADSYYSHVKGNIHFFKNKNGLFFMVDDNSLEDVIWIDRQYFIEKVATLS